MSNFDADFDLTQDIIVEEEVEDVDNNVQVVIEETDERINDEMQDLTDYFGDLVSLKEAQITEALARVAIMRNELLVIRRRLANQTQLQELTHLRLKKRRVEVTEVTTRTIKTFLDRGDDEIVDL